MNTVVWVVAVALMLIGGLGALLFWSGRKEIDLEIELFQREERFFEADTSEMEKDDNLRRIRFFLGIFLLGAVLTGYLIFR